MKHKFLRKLFNFFLSFLLLFQGSAPYFVVFAQEASTPSAEIIVEPPAPPPPPESTPEVTPTPTPEWQTIDNVDITTQSVGEGHTYKYRNTAVSVTFTKVTQPGLLKIKEVKIGEDTGYDITSDMPDGTFIYDLTLPNPNPNQDTKVQYSEDGQTYQDINSEKQNDLLVIKDLNHFTIFVVRADTPTNTGSSNTDDSSAGSVCVDGGSGSVTCYQTIQSAVDAASSEDTINIVDGTYSDPVTIDKPLTLSCQSNTGTIINAGSSNIGISLIGGADNVTIKNCKITGNGDGINADGISNLTLQDLIIDNNTFATSGVYLSNVTTANISGTTFSNNVVGLDLAGTTSGVTVSISTFLDNSPYHISNNTVSDVAATSGNDWGTFDGADINSRIYDQLDDPDLGLVWYDDTDPIVSAGADNTTNTSFDQTGTATDDFYGIERVEWSGPGEIIFGNSSALTTSVSATTDGTYIITLTAWDYQGNSSSNEFTLIWDITNPTSDIEYPEDEEIYTQDSWNGEISGTATDELSSGVSKVYVSIQADNGDYWCDENECGDGYGWYSEDEGETLNETDFDSESGEWFYEFDFIPEEGTQGYTARSHAKDNAGNLEETNTVRFYFFTDTIAPVSEFSSPEEGSFWNSPIDIQGSSTDEPDTTVDYVKFYYRISGEEENPWNEIPDSQQNNEDKEELFEWDFDWTPDSEGTFDIKAKATDKAGNVENSPVVEYVTYDVTGPVVSTPLASPDPTNHPPQILADAVDAISNIASAIFSVNDPDFLFAKPLEVLDGFFDSLAETLFGPEFTNGMDYPGEGLHTLYVGAYDEAGNFGSNSGLFTVDTIAPVSSFSSPEDGFTTNSPIEISGSSSDESEDTVDFVQLFYRESIGEGEEENEWTEIEQLTNSEGAEPFEWNFNWTPDVEGTFDIKAEATDTAGNLELSPVVSDVVYDTTAPVVSWISPTAGATISGSASLDISATDALSGVASIQYQYRRNTGIDIFHDISGSAWDTTGLALDTYTLRAIVTDKADNSTTIDRLVEVAAVVSGQASTTPSDSSAVISWTTDRLTSSRVVYDTVSHGSLGVAPNYGYANSTGTSDTSPKVLSHSVIISGLSDGTIYYYRTISAGSPVAIGDERTYKTLSRAGAPSPSGDGGGGGGAVAGISTIFTPPATLFPAQFIPVEEILGEATVSAEIFPIPTPISAPTPEVAGVSAFNWWLVVAPSGLLLLFLLGLIFWRK